MYLQSTILTLVALCTVISWFPKLVCLYVLYWTSSSSGRLLVSACFLMCGHPIRVALEVPNALALALHIGYAEPTFFVVWNEQRHTLVLQDGLSLADVVASSNPRQPNKAGLSFLKIGLCCYCY